MKGLPQGRYTKEFPAGSGQAGNGKEGCPYRRWDGSLALPPSTLGNWVKAYKAGKLAEVGKTRATTDRSGNRTGASQT